MSLVTLTTSAVKQMTHLLNKKPGAKGIQLLVIKSGCAGMGYHLDYVQKPLKDAQVVEQDGITIYLPSASLLFLIGCEVDYVTSDLEQKFVFNNPNQTDACGCGESVTLKAYE